MYVCSCNKFDYFVVVKTSEIVEITFACFVIVVCPLSFPNVFSLLKVGQVFEFIWQKALA